VGDGLLAHGVVMERAGGEDALLVFLVGKGGNVEEDEAEDNVLGDCRDEVVDRTCGVVFHGHEVVAIVDGAREEEDQEDDEVQRDQNELDDDRAAQGDIGLILSVPEVGCRALTELPEERSREEDERKRVMNRVVPAIQEEREESQ